MSEWDTPEWKELEWIKPYLRFITNTGGNSVVEMMNDHTIVQVNAPRAMIAVAVKSQVAMLEHMHAQGVIGPEVWLMDVMRHEFTRLDWKRIETALHSRCAHLESRYTEHPETEAVKRLWLIVRETILKVKE